METTMKSEKEIREQLQRFEKTIQLYLHRAQRCEDERLQDIYRISLVECVGAKNVLKWVLNEKTV